VNVVLLGAAFGVLTADGADDSFPTPKAALGLGVLLTAAGWGVYFLVGRLAEQISVLDRRLADSLATARDELGKREIAQAQVERSLLEKELLLKEVHHRVKNNLQIVLSIINLQLRRTSNSEVAMTLAESSNRIHSIAMMHEALYHSENIASIRVTDYLIDLMGQILTSAERGLELELVVEPSSGILEVERVIPLGLIATELLVGTMRRVESNTAQTTGGVHKQPPSGHAVSKPLVRIKAMQMPSGGLIFSYTEKGMEPSKGGPGDSEDSVGGRLVATLIRQLRGRLNILSADGTAYQIIIPGKEERDTQYGQAAYSYR
jgi:two-component sensor histidine kinase